MKRPSQVLSLQSFLNGCLELDRDTPYIIYALSKPRCNSSSSPYYVPSRPPSPFSVLEHMAALARSNPIYAVQYTRVMPGWARTRPSLSKLRAHVIYQSLQSPEALKRRQGMANATRRISSKSLPIHPPFFPFRWARSALAPASTHSKYAEQTPLVPFRLRHRCASLPKAAQVCVRARLAQRGGACDARLVRTVVD